MEGVEDCTVPTFQNSEGPACLENQYSKSWLSPGLEHRPLLPAGNMQLSQPLGNCRETFGFFYIIASFKKKIKSCVFQFLGNCKSSCFICWKIFETYAKNTGIHRFFFSMLEWEKGLFFLLFLQFFFFFLQFLIFFSPQREEK